MVNINFFSKKFPKGVSPLYAGVEPRSKVSCKVATGEGRTEVSETKLFELTNRNGIRGMVAWVSKHIIAKP
jgi:phosphoribosylformylglycinamidine (FGAM) synthase-like amidotransferase family enzyme